MNKVELFSMFNRPHLLPSLISKTEAEEAEVRGGDEVGIGVYMPHKPHPFRGPQPLDVSLLNKILGCIDPTAKPVTIDPESGMLVGVKKIQNQRIYRMVGPFFFFHYFIFVAFFFCIILSSLHGGSSVFIICIILSSLHGGSSVFFFFSLIYLRCMVGPVFFFFFFFFFCIILSPLHGGSSVFFFFFFVLFHLRLA